MTAPLLSWHQQAAGRTWIQAQGVNARPDQLHRIPDSPVHAARRAEQHEPQVRDRWAHHQTCRLHRFAADPKTGGGTVRLDQNSRTGSPGPLHRQRPQRGLVQDGSRRLQPDPDHRARRRHRMTITAGTAPPTTLRGRGSVSDHRNPTSRIRRKSTSRDTTATAPQARSVTGRLRPRFSAPC